MTRPAWGLLRREVCNLHLWQFGFAMVADVCVVSVDVFHVVILPDRCFQTMWRFCQNLKFLWQISHLGDWVRACLAVCPSRASRQGLPRRRVPIRYTLMSVTGEARQVPLQCWLSVGSQSLGRFCQKRENCKPINHLAIPPWGPCCGVSRVIPRDTTTHS